MQSQKGNLWGKKKRRKEIEQTPSNVPAQEGNIKKEREKGVIFWKGGKKKKVFSG